MAAAILNQGKTAIRDSLTTLVTHVCVADDSAAFVLTQTGINPTAAATSTHVGASTDTAVDANTFDSTITIDGTTQFTGKNIFAIGIAKGLGVRSATGSGGSGAPSARAGLTQAPIARPRHGAAPAARERDDDEALAVLMLALP